MTADSQQQPESDPGAGDSVRAAVERTMRATAGSAATTRDRAADLVDEVVRRGRDAGAGLARRGQEATGEVGKRLEALERRLGELESNLASERAARAEDQASSERNANPTAEG
jgi:polyhydroxyalkanoate synthesis regulator phasin